MTPAVGNAQTSTATPAAPPKYSPDVPAKITTPDTVETRIGTLRFRDGAPDPATVQLAYDQLDFAGGSTPSSGGCRPPRCTRRARLYGPLEPWFNKSWRAGDFELRP